jgi:hypothetical protein
MILTLGLMCGVLFACAASAAASTPAQNAYGGPCSSGKTLCEPSSLPFTGINVMAVLGLSAGLLGTGLVLRRTVRQQ